MNKQLDEELKRLCGAEPDYFDRYEARHFWLWKLAKAFVISAFIVTVLFTVWGAIL